MRAARMTSLASRQVLSTHICIARVSVCDMSASSAVTASAASLSADPSARRSQAPAGTGSLAPSIHQQNVQLRVSVKPNPHLTQQSQQHDASRSHVNTHMSVHRSTASAALCRAGLCAAGKSRKRTEEGYAVYSEEELGLGKKGGGDTPQCPFDCNCCF